MFSVFLTQAEAVDEPRIMFLRRRQYVKTNTSKYWETVPVYQS